MPDTNTTDAVATPGFNLADVKLAAQAKYQEGVTKELTKKYSVIAKRQSQIDAFVAAWNARVKEFEDAINAATTPAQISEVVNAHKFPACSIHFTPKQDE